MYIYIKSLLAHDLHIYMYIYISYNQSFAMHSSISHFYSIMFPS